MVVFPELNENSSIGDILFANIGRYGPLLQLTDDLMRGEGVIAIKDREMLAAFVSGLNECAFCHGVHEATALRFGVQSGALEALLSDVDTADVDASIKPLFVFAKKLTLEPSKVTEQDRLLVLEAGHDSNTLKDLIGIVSLFGLFNRLLDGHGVVGNGSLFERDSAMLHDHGYSGPPA